MSTHPNWKYTSAAENGQEFACDTVLSKFKHKCAGPVYGLHIRANGFAYSAFIKAPGYVKKGKEEGEEWISTDEGGILGTVQVSHLRIQHACLMCSPSMAEFEPFKRNNT